MLRSSNIVLEQGAIERAARCRLSSMRLHAALVTVVALASCAGWYASTPDVDRLAFLAGCWKWFHIDWGFTLCWNRTADTWRGDYADWTQYGNSTAVVTIKTRDRTLELSARPAAKFWDIDRVPLTSFTGSAIGFGTGEQHVELSHDRSTDMLLLSFGPRMPFPCEYPCTPRLLQFRLQRLY